MLHIYLIITFKVNAQSRNRTSDTRIFSPLLYQLSYLGISSGNRIWTYDLRVMSPTSFQTAPSRDIFFWKQKPMIGLEPITCWLQISCSANWATSARNHWLQQMNYIHQMDGEGFEPSKASPADLQSVPFGHSGIHPYGTYRARTYDPLLVRQMLSQLS